MTMVVITISFGGQERGDLPKYPRGQKKTNDAEMGGRKKEKHYLIFIGWGPDFSPQNTHHVCLEFPASALKKHGTS